MGHCTITNWVHWAWPLYWRITSTISQIAPLLLGDHVPSMVMGITVLDNICSHVFHMGFHIGMSVPFWHAFVVHCGSFLKLCKIKQSVPKCSQYTCTSFVHMNWFYNLVLVENDQFYGLKCNFCNEYWRRIFFIWPIWYSRSLHETYSIFKTSSVEGELILKMNETRQSVWLLVVMQCIHHIASHRIPSTWK